MTDDPLPDLNDQRKSTWLLFLESSGGAALITVLIGGLLVQIISCDITTKQKDREFEQSFIKAKADQSLLAYKEFVDQAQQLIKHAYDLIGNCISASEDLISLTTKDFNPWKYTGKNREAITNQRKSHRQNFNLAEQQWRKEQENIGFLMSYYHKDRPGVIEAWQKVQLSIRAYTDCAQESYKLSLKAKVANRPCENDRNTCRQRLDELMGKLQSSRRDLWDDWETVEKFRTQTGLKK